MIDDFDDFTKKWMDEAKGIHLSIFKNEDSIDYISGDKIVCFSHNKLLSEKGIVEYLEPIFENSLDNYRLFLIEDKKIELWGKSLGLIYSYMSLEKIINNSDDDFHKAKIIKKRLYCNPIFRSENRRILNHFYSILDIRLNTIVD